MPVYRSQIIDRDESSFETWQPPIVEGPITATLNDSPPKPPTAREMQALQKHAYDEGFELGRKEGRDRGFAQGQKEGQENLNDKIQLLTGLLDLMWRCVTRYPP